MRRLAWIAPVLALGLGACGGMSDAERFDLRTPGSDRLVVTDVSGGEEKDAPAKKPPTKAEVKVIKGWADALRKGRIAKASAYFAVPSLVLNPPIEARLTTRSAVRYFNSTLSCGSEVVETVRGEGAFIIAAFRLTERPGPGECGTGVGNIAHAAILVRDGHIEQWIRQD